MAATQSDGDTYRPTAEMPFRPQRQTRLSRILDSPVGTTDDLVDEAYIIAAEDAWNMAEILRTVNRRVIGAIIDGTIGHKYHTDFDFRKLFPPTDELTGICLNTLVCARDGKGLTGTEWMEVQAVMQEYVVRFSNIWMRANSLKIYRR